MFGFSFRVTTDSGEQYLVHKGPGFGKSGQTVVVDAKHMSDNWQVNLIPSRSCSAQSPLNSHACFWRDCNRYKAIELASYIQSCLGLEKLFFFFYPLFYSLILRGYTYYSFCLTYYSQLCSFTSNQLLPRNIYKNCMYSRESRAFLMVILSEWSNKVLVLVY